MEEIQVVLVTECIEVPTKSGGVGFIASFTGEKAIGTVFSKTAIAKDTVLEVQLNKTTGYYSYSTGITAAGGVKIKAHLVERKKTFAL